MGEKIICRVITGPTASRKTELSVQLALEMGWEILCMDSMQIYRRMNIGTAKPKPEEMHGVRHHLMDICEPTDSFSVAAWRDRAEALVRELAREGKNALFVGGTGLYLRAMTQGMEMGAVPANEELRRELKELAEKPGGKEILHSMLEKEDPETAARLPQGDVRRVIRAIEVTRGTGVPFSRQRRREYTSPFEWRIVSTAMERTRLYERINQRVDHMIQEGLEEEVAGLLREGVPADAQSMQGLGYKEMVPRVLGKCSLEEAAEAIRIGSRHYAKRQMTFLRREENVHYVNVEEGGAALKIRNILGV